MAAKGSLLLTPFSTSPLPALATPSSLAPPRTIRHGVGIVVLRCMRALGRGGSHEHPLRRSVRAKPRSPLHSPYALNGHLGSVDQLDVRLARMWCPPVAHNVRQSARTHASKHHHPQTMPLKSVGAGNFGVAKAGEGDEVENCIQRREPSWSPPPSAAPQTPSRFDPSCTRPCSPPRIIGC